LRKARKEERKPGKKEKKRKTHSIGYIYFELTKKRKKTDGMLRIYTTSSTFLCVSTFQTV